MNAEQAGAYAPLLPPRVHRGSGMKALPPGSGGREARPRRPLGARLLLRPVPPERRRGKRRARERPFPARWAAALAASLLAAATLLLAPGEARAQFCLGATTATNADVTCSAATYPVSIRSTIQSNANVTVRVPGGTGAGGTATVITGSTFYAGINLLASDQSQTGNYAIYVGTTAAVSIVDDTGSGNESPGIRIRQHGSGTATVDVRSQVTIGTSTSSRMRAHGIYVRSSGSGGAATITNAGTIYASYEGIDVQHDGAATTTVTHSGAIDSLNHGIQAVTDGAGALMVTSSGNITVTNANQQGIRMRAQKNGAMTLTATGGTITTPAQGIYMESQGTGTVTIQGTAASAPDPERPHHHVVGESRHPRPQVGELGHGGRRLHHHHRRLDHARHDGELLRHLRPGPRHLYRRRHHRQRRRRHGEPAGHLRFQAGFRRRFRHQPRRHGAELGLVRHLRQERGERCQHRERLHHGRHGANRGHGRGGRLGRQQRRRRRQRRHRRRRHGHIQEPCRHSRGAGELLGQPPG